ncbi:MAG: hypothetical protein WDN69_05510 [Aliidongia sp.]
MVIAVNARSDARNPLDASPEYTDLLDMASAVSGVLVDSASAGSAANFQAFVTNLAEDRASLLRQGVKQAAFEIYPGQHRFRPAAGRDHGGARRAQQGQIDRDQLDPGEGRCRAAPTRWRASCCGASPCFRKLLARHPGPGPGRGARRARGALPRGAGVEHPAVKPSTSPTRPMRWSDSRGSDRPHRPAPGPRSLSRMPWPMRFMV